MASTFNLTITLQNTSGINARVVPWDLPLLSALPSQALKCNLLPPDRKYSRKSFLTTCYCFENSLYLQSFSLRQSLSQNPSSRAVSSCGNDQDLAFLTLYQHFLSPLGYLDSQNQRCCLPIATPEFVLLECSTA